jgi:hypothetical protein
VGAVGSASVGVGAMTMTGDLHDSGATLVGVLGRAGVGGGERCVGYQWARVDVGAAVGIGAFVKGFGDVVRGRSTG